MVFFMYFGFLVSLYLCIYAPLHTDTHQYIYMQTTLSMENTCNQLLINGSVSHLGTSPGGYSDLGWVRMCGPEFQLLPYSKT